MANLEAQASLGGASRAPLGRVRFPSVATLLDRVSRKALLHIPPELARAIGVVALRTGAYPRFEKFHDSRLRVQTLGLDFETPLGIAAGMDKDAVIFGPLLRDMASFVEVGTVTPLPQAGNARPRLFRLSEDRAYINRFGFNSVGHDRVHANLTGRDPKSIIGVNIGANKDSNDRINDYVLGVAKFADLASYIVVNVSSPNTAGLRDLQRRDALDELLQRVLEERDRQTAQTGKCVPLLLKVAPDLDRGQVKTIAELAMRRRVDGLVVANTTLSRDGLKSAGREQPGGLSGRPLFERSTAILAMMREAVGSEMVLIGVGGIDSGDKAFAKLSAGANLLQYYTSLVYDGLDTSNKILKQLTQIVSSKGYRSVSEIVSSDTAYWTRPG